MLRIARLLAKREKLRVTALHCRLENESSPGEPPMRDWASRSDETDEHPLAPLMREEQDDAIEALEITCARVDEGILTTARERSKDLILMGWHRPMVHDDSEPGPVGGVLERAECDVAVFLSRRFRPVRSVLVPFHGGRHDRRALDLAARIAHSTDVSVTVLHVIAPNRPDAAPGTGWSDLVEDLSDGRVRLKVVESDDPVDAAVREAWTGYDLILAGASDVWGVDFSIFTEPLKRLAFATPASLLVVRACAQQRPAHRSHTKRPAISTPDGPSAA